tara:strand:+ start:1857 stop:1982 length:126 start_codon:yes stop_codon:yes gene_type:complete
VWNALYKKLPLAYNHLPLLEKLLGVVKLPMRDAFKKKEINL